MAKRIKETINSSGKNQNKKETPDSNKLKDMFVIYEEINKKIKNNEDISIYKDFLTESNKYVNKHLGINGKDEGVHFDGYLDYYTYTVVKTAALVKQVLIKELGRQIVFYEEYEQAKAKKETTAAVNEYLFGTKFWSYDQNDNQDKRIRNREFYTDDTGRTWLTKPDNKGFDAKVEAIVKNKKIIPFYITKIFGEPSEWRTISFNATIGSLNQTFNPSWDTSDFFGRTEGLHFYTNTDRNISVEFKLIPDSIEDLPYIYKKLDWLTKLTYAEYDDEGNFSCFPIVRLKIGDLICWNNMGLAGFLTDLSHEFNPGEYAWETINGLRVPQAIEVSFNFKPIHDEIPRSNKDYHIFHTRNIADDEDEREMDLELKSYMQNRKDSINKFIDERVDEKYSKFWDEIYGIISNIPARVAKNTDAALRDRIQTESRLLWRKLNNEI